MDGKNNGAEKRIEEFADLFLNTLDYSPAFAEANDRIRAALREKAKELSFEELAESCGSLEKMAALAGYSAQDVKAWRGSGTALDTDTLKRELRIQQRRIYGIALLLTAAISEAVWAVFNAVHRNSELPLSVALVLLLLAGVGFVRPGTYAQSGLSKQSQVVHTLAAWVDSFYAGHHEEISEPMDE